MKPINLDDVPDLVQNNPVGIKRRKELVEFMKSEYDACELTLFCKTSAPDMIQYKKDLERLKLEKKMYLVHRAGKVYAVKIKG